MRDSSYYFGLTGGVASGKTTAARMFQELGATIIEADCIGHELLSPPLPAYQEVVRHFGREIVNAAGEIERSCLAAKVFSDPTQLAKLNAILHPRIIERVEELAARYHAQDPRAVVLVDAALIYEAGIGVRFKKMVVTWCRPEQQIERLMAKTGLSREQAERRIAAQMPAGEKRRRADYVIDCSGSLENTRRQVEALYPQLRRLVEGNGDTVA
jgi:dephospho-CoA kinase